MTSQYKICNNCGEKVESDYNFCPNCKSQSFRESSIEVRKDYRPNHIIAKLLYWENDGGYVLSKSKIAGICTFLTFVIAAGPGVPLWSMLVIGIIVGLIAFLGGLLIHLLMQKKPSSKLHYNSDGVIIDLAHLFFFWQNGKTGEFVLSKTKIISLLIFVIVFVYAANVAPFSLFASVVFSVLIEIPVFVVGYLIHRSTNPYPTNPTKVEGKKPKEIKDVKKVEQKPQAPVLEKTLIPAFENYKAKINKLQVEFNAKDEVARELIEKRFQPPQMTYTRFISLVDKSNKMFDKEADAALTIINLATEDSPRVDAEIKSKINILKSIISKIDDLTNELVLTMDTAKDSDVEEFIDDMEGVIGSLKDYK